MCLIIEIMWGFNSEKEKQSPVQDSSSSDHLQPTRSGKSVTGTIRELDADVLANVNGGVIAANVDDSNRNLPLAQYTYYAEKQRVFE